MEFLDSNVCDDASVTWYWNTLLASPQYFRFLLEILNVIVLSRTKDFHCNDSVPRTVSASSNVQLGLGEHRAIGMTKWGNPVAIVATLRYISYNVILQEGNGCICLPCSDI